MKRAVFCLVVAGVLLMGSLAGAQETVLYDNFDGKTLDPDEMVWKLGARTREWSRSN